MNNYNKIKQMSVDEMAEWLSASAGYFKCELCAHSGIKYDVELFCACYECSEGIKEWLLKEVEE